MIWVLTICCSIIVIGIIMVILGNVNWHKPMFFKVKNKSVKEKLLCFLYRHNVEFYTFGWLVIIFVGVITLVILYGISTSYIDQNIQIVKMN